jgi:FixJ family two-component response regulator
MSTVEECRLVAIVDDEKAVCRAIGRLVMSAGLESAVFSSAEEFLRSCRERRPDCLILDLRLPGMSGLELQQQLATDHCRTPIRSFAGRIPKNGTKSGVGNGL